MLNITTITTAGIPQCMCSYINIVRLQPVMLYFLPITLCRSDFIIMLHNCNAQNCAHEKTCVVCASLLATMLA